MGYLTNASSHALKAIFIATAALSLTACGGGGGGSGDSRRTPLEKPVNTRLSPDGDTETLTMISGNAPRQGSVTQGTRGQGNVSLDSTSFDPNSSTIIIRTSADRTIRVPITTERWSGFSYGLDGLPEDYSGAYFQAENDDQGRAIAYVMSRVNKDENGLPTKYALDASDPVVMGTWAYINDDDTEVISGFFVDGLAENETPAADIPNSGTASFTGDTYGWFSGPALESAYNISSAHFNAAISLTADWNTSNISGTVRDFHYLFAPNTPSSALLPHTRRNDFAYEPNADQKASPTINLEAAAIDRTKLGGFFTGATDYQSDRASGNGKWGGQFYGGDASAVAGTWGVDAVSIETGQGFAASGVFSAEKQ